MKFLRYIFLLALDFKSMILFMMTLIFGINAFVSFFNLVVDSSDYKFTHIFQLALDFYAGYRAYIFGELLAFIRLPLVVQDALIFYFSFAAVWGMQYSFIRMRDERKFEQNPAAFEAMIREAARLGKKSPDEAWKIVKKGLDSKISRRIGITKSAVLWPVGIYRNIRGILLNSTAVRLNSLSILIAFICVLFIYTAMTAYILKFEIIENMD